MNKMNMIVEYCMLWKSLTPQNVEKMKSNIRIQEYKMLNNGFTEDELDKIVIACKESKTVQELQEKCSGIIKDIK